MLKVHKWTLTYGAIVCETGLDVLGKHTELYKTEKEIKELFSVLEKIIEDFSNSNDTKKGKQKWLKNVTLIEDH